MPEPREDTGTVARDHTQRARAERGPRGRLERVRQDRRRQGAVVVAAIVIGLIAGSLGSSRNPSARAATAPTPTTVAAAAVPATTVLVAHVDTKHRLDLLAVAGVNTGGRVGSIVFVPTTTLVEVPSFDTQQLVNVPGLGASTLLATTVANALGLHFDAVMVLDDADLTSLLAPAGELQVTFVQPVQVDDAAGTLAFSPGRASVSAVDATRLLIGPASGGALEHLVAVQAVLEGWFARLRIDSVARATERRVPLARSLVPVARADINFDTVPVDVLSSGSTTAYELQEPEAARLIAADFPEGLTNAGYRPHVEVLNGTGAIALTQAVAQRIVPAGVEITLTGNVPGFGVRHTTVVYYEPAELPAARRLVAALGVGSVALGNVPIDVVDLTVVVGADFHPKRR